MISDVDEKVRCAVYTRKSTTEGLEQDFNTLEAQREAAEAYIASQRGEDDEILLAPETHLPSAAAPSEYVLRQLILFHRDV